MVLTVEDGTGLTTADAYDSLANVDTYLANYTDTGVAAYTTWDGLADAAKEEAIRIATQYLDSRYGPRFRGYRKTKNQTLLWPRSGAEDNDGYEIDDDSVPRDLQRAMAELALLQASETDGIQPDLSSPGIIKREKDKVGPVETEVEYQGGKLPTKQFVKVEALLNRLVWPAGRIRRS